jgi:hypothetical protein
LKKSSLEGEAELSLVSLSGQKFEPNSVPKDQLNYLLVVSAKNNSFPIGFTLGAVQARQRKRKGRR